MPKRLALPVRSDAIASPLPLPPNWYPGVGVPLLVPLMSASKVTPLAAPEIFVLPSSQMVLLPVRSVIPRFPAPSALPPPAEMMFQVCPPELLLPSANHVPKPFELCTVTGWKALPATVRVPATDWLPTKVLAVANCGTLVVSRFNVTLPLVPPPVRSVPEVTPVMVPLPLRFAHPHAVPFHCSTWFAAQLVIRLRLSVPLVPPPVSPLPLPVVTPAMPAYTKSSSGG